MGLILDIRLKIVLILLLFVGCNCESTKTKEESVIFPLIIKKDIHSPIPRINRSELSSCGLIGIDRSSASSVYCLECHDGSVAVGIGESHPYDVDYFNSKLPNLNPFPPAIIVLNGGLVVCTSCHDGESSLSFHVISYGNQEICFACHVL